jgi:hypothetical protein
VTVRRIPSSYSSAPTQAPPSNNVTRSCQRDRRDRGEGGTHQLRLARTSSVSEASGAPSSGGTVSPVAGATPKVRNGNDLQQPLMAPSVDDGIGKASRKNPPTPPDQGSTGLGISHGEVDRASPVRRSRTARSRSRASRNTTAPGISSTSPASISATLREISSSHSAPTSAGSISLPRNRGSPAMSARARPAAGAGDQALRRGFPLSSGTCADPPVSESRQSCPNDTTGPPFIP